MDESGADRQEAEAQGPKPQAPDAATTPEPTPDDRPMRERVLDAIGEVYDPEIPVNIRDLGLIYKVDVDEKTGRVEVEMTLTTPNCPEAQSLPGEVRLRAMSVAGVSEANVQIVWDPPWDREMMSDEAKLRLGLM